MHRKRKRKRIQEEKRIGEKRKGEEGKRRNEKKGKEERRITEKRQRRQMTRRKRRENGLTLNETLFFFCIHISFSLEERNKRGMTDTQINKQIDKHTNKNKY